MLFVRVVLGIAIDLEVGETIEHDVRAVLESNFYERVLTRPTGNHGVDAAGAADPAAMNVSEVRGLRMHLANGDCAPHEHLRPSVHIIAPEKRVLLVAEFAQPTLRSQPHQSYGA
jgi:hypothetical protein